MGLNIQKVQVGWMGLKAKWGFLPQRGLREQECFSEPAASGDGGVGPRWSTRRVSSLQAPWKGRAVAGSCTSSSDKSAGFIKVERKIPDSGS